MQRESVLTSGLPDDQLFESRGTWWRYRFDWQGGAGRQILDFGEEQDPTRYEASWGIDPWTPYQLQLLPRTESHIDELADVDVSLHRLVQAGTYLYEARGASGVRRIGPDAATLTAITGIAGTVRDMATDGLDVFVATSTNLYKIVNGATAAVTITSATAPAGGYTHVGFVANRLLAAAKNKLYEVFDATLDLILEHYQDDFTWTASFAIGSRIYAGGFAGERSEISVLQTLSDGTLVTGVDTSPPLGSGRLHAAVGYAGAAIIATSRGVRFAQLSGDATLVFGPLIDTPGPVRTLAVQDRYCWFNWDDHPSGAGAGLGRLDLARQSDLQPSYASDVWAEQVGRVGAVARWNGETWFKLTDDTLTEASIHATMTDEYVTEGKIRSGRIYFGAVERKVVTQLLLRFTPLEADEMVVAEIVNDVGSLLGGCTACVPGQPEIEYQLEGHFANWVELDIMLKGPGTSTPTLRLWRASAFPVAPPTEQWLVPLIIQSSAIVGDGEGEQRAYEVLAEVNVLAALWADKRMVAYQEGDETYRVRIDNYEMAPMKWNDEGKFFETTTTVRLYRV